MTSMSAPSQISLWLCRRGLAAGAFVALLPHRCAGLPSHTPEHRGRLTPVVLRWCSRMHSFQCTLTALVSLLRRLAVPVPDNNYQSLYGHHGNRLLKTPECCVNVLCESASPPLCFSFSHKIFMAMIRRLSSKTGYSSMPWRP